MHIPLKHSRLYLASLAALLFLVQGCSLYDKGALSGYAWALALSIEDYLGRLYLPHVLALQMAEEKVISGTPAVEAVSGMDTLPGVKAVVVASSKAGGSFTIPPDYGLTDSEYRQLHPDSVSYRKKIKPHKRVLPTHNTLLAGKYRSHTLKGSKGRETMIVTRDIPQAGNDWITIGYIVDIDWFIPQIPVLMDSLTRDFMPLALAKTSPAGGLYESDIAIAQVEYKDFESSSGEHTVKRIIWSTESYGKREQTHGALVFPFKEELYIKVGLYYVDE